MRLSLQGKLAHRLSSQIDEPKKQPFEGVKMIKSATHCKSITMVHYVFSLFCGFTVSHSRQRQTEPALLSFA